MDGRSGSLQLEARTARLIAAHCRSLDPDAAPARRRLERALGPELARKLVCALASHPGKRAA
ncbi:MAG TPA: hypothetical protein VFJ77_06165 [Gaiellaceae bacterium]|nr:hypothetical protein [Gaiellaceae bacterium]